MKLFKSRFSIITIGIIAVFIIAAVCAIIFSSLNPGNKDIVVAKCNGIEITKSVFQMYLFSCASQYKNEIVPYASDIEYNAMTDEEKDEYNKKRESFWDTEIDGKMPLDIVKEKTIEAVKVYSYFKTQCELNNVSMTKEEIQGFNSSMETLIDSKNIDTLKSFGVEKEWYISYLLDMEIFEKYSITGALTNEVSESEIKNYFDENLEEYAKITVNTIFLKSESEDDRDDLEKTALDIKKKLEEGISFKTLSDSYSDYKGNNDGNFIVDSNSSLSSVFGDEYIKSVLTSSSDKIETIETSKGFCINRILKIDMNDTAKDNIIAIIQDNKYMNQVESIVKNNSVYKVEIVNQEEYDSITIPEVLR